MRFILLLSVVILAVLLNISYCYKPVPKATVSEFFENATQHQNSAIHNLLATAQGIDKRLDSMEKVSKGNTERISKLEAKMAQIDKASAEMSSATQNASDNTTGTPVS